MTSSTSSLPPCPVSSSPSVPAFHTHARRLALPAAAGSFAVAPLPAARTRARNAVNPQTGEYCDGMPGLAQPRTSAVSEDKMGSTSSSRFRTNSSFACVRARPTAEDAFQGHPRRGSLPCDIQINVGRSLSPCGHGCIPSLAVYRAPSSAYGLVQGQAPERGVDSEFEKTCSTAEHCEHVGVSNTYTRPNSSAHFAGPCRAHEGRGLDLGGCNTMVDGRGPVHLLQLQLGCVQGGSSCGSPSDAGHETRAKLDQPEFPTNLSAPGTDLGDAAADVGCGVDVGGPGPLRVIRSGPPASANIGDGKTEDRPNPSPDLPVLGNFPAHSTSGWPRAIPMTGILYRRPPSKHT